MRLKIYLIIAIEIFSFNSVPWTIIIVSLHILKYLKIKFISKKKKYWRNFWISIFCSLSLYIFLFILFLLFFLYIKNHMRNNRNKIILINDFIYYNILNIFINQIKYRNKIILFTGIYPVLNTLIQFQLSQLLTMRYCNYHLKPI